MNVVSTFVQLGAGIDHYWLATVSSVENVEIAVGICFEKNPNPVATPKDARRIRSNGKPIRIPHEEG